MTMTNPTPAQAALSYSLLLALSLVTAPFSLIAVLLARLFRRSGPSLTRNGKTVLINGGRMQKSIFIAKAMAAKGYRVIMAEERGWGEVCAARFSNRVDRFVLVPAGGGGAYIAAMVKLIVKEKVDLFIPCSGAGTTLEDAKVAAIARIERHGHLQSLIQEPALVETLHEKVCIAKATSS